MEEITQDDLMYFRKQLTAQLEELLTIAEQTVTSLVQPGERAADPLDQAAIENVRNYTLHIRDRECHLIKKIKTALEKINDGSFGICEECGDDIALARLKARPVTAYCIQCKTKIEAFEKVTGF